MPFRTVTCRHFGLDLEFIVLIVVHHLFVTGPNNQCDVKTVGITIKGLEFKDAYRNKASIEYQQLASNVTAAVSLKPLCPVYTYL